MSNPDYVQEVLDYLSTNWNTSTFSPQPRLIDGDEIRDDDTGDRAKGANVKEENIITVDSDPTGQNEPIGTEFDYRHQFGAHVKCEAYHTDGGGEITDKDAFDTMWGESRRAILTEREFPVGEDTYLTIEDEDDGSSDAGDAHYFIYEYDVFFHGFESLP